MVYWGTSDALRENGTEQDWFSSSPGDCVSIQVAGNHGKVLFPMTLPNLGVLATKAWIFLYSQLVLKEIQG